MVRRKSGERAGGDDPHQGLTKQFGEVKAIADLDRDVRAGEVFGYLGPNGAGKTTTIRLLLDFIRPTRGAAAVLGGSGADPEIRRRIGYLPGELRLDRRYTARDVIAIAGIATFLRRDLH